MYLACHVLLSAALLGVSAAQQQPPAQQPPAQQTPAQQPPAQPQEKKPEQKPEQKPEEPQKYEETVVVSASKAEEKLINAPATMSVVTSKQIESAPTQNFAELLRSVPGVNVTQVSARDINVTSRGATGTLSTGQLALLDGRSLYQDFFGFVMWDFLPVNYNEIKQVEVVRGPASAVWGANALFGVVNVIMKSPREMQGTSGTFGFGGFDRGDAADAGTLWYISGTHAQAINDRWAYKISAGGYSQDALARPTGTVPCDRPEVCTLPRATYPPFTNEGTTQPKFDARVDYDYPDGRKLSFSGGVAGTDGIMHSGIGPFDINSGTVMGYVKANYTQKAFRASFFTNILNGDAANLLAFDPLTGRQITFNFNTKTYDFELSNVQTFAARHVVSYGGNLRFNLFDLSIAPDADNRTEFGVYGQDEIFLGKYFRAIVGARVDRFDYVDNVSFSPRTTLMIKPADDHTFRVSYNRAYASPSVINNFLEVVIAQPVNLSALGGPANYNLPINAVGNPDLTIRLVDAFEVGYSGVLMKRAIVSAAFFVNKLKDDIFFTEDVTGRYTAANPPPNWPLPPALINFVPGRSLPGRFTYLNFGHYTQKGLELGVNSPVNTFVDVFANYSWQGTPDPKDFSLTELNIPAKNRFNAGVGVNYGRFLGTFSVSYSGSAFWQDVLNDPFHGTTDAYTLVNGGFGVKWAHDRVTTSVKVINLTNEDILQHVFGDVLKRQVVGELRVQF